MTNMVKILVLTFSLADVKPELIKRSNAPMPQMLWSGENNLEKFEDWLTETLMWISGSSWKGLAYNELQITALSHALEGDLKQIMLHDMQLGYAEGHIPNFLELLLKLIITFIKKSAAVPVTKLFKLLTCDSKKGIKYSYLQLLHMLKRMI